MALTVVIDANVALGSALPLPYSPDADRRMDEWRDVGAAMAAPVLWSYEVLTGLRRAAWERLVGDEELEAAFDLLEALELELFFPSAGLNRAALERAGRLGQNKAHDGHYLAVAEHQGAQFWTAGRRLAHALSERGVSWAHWLGER